MAHKHMTGPGYLLTYAALIALASLSLGLSYVHWPFGEVVVALVIATLKAFLVVWFFMHLVEQRFANRLVLLVSVFFVLLLVTLTATDVATRHTFPKRLRPTAGEPFYQD